MRQLVFALFLGAACNDSGGAADLSVPVDLAAASDLRAAADLATSCSLATVNADCAASCGTPDGGLGGTAGPNWPCQPDPICSGGHWQFDCIRR